jgi:hypothetical protein
VHRGQTGATLIALCALTATPQADAAKAPVFWSKFWVQKQVYARYSSSEPAVSCAPVGPASRQHDVEFFGEFACQLDPGDGNLYTLAVIPTGTSTWRMLNPGQPSPVAGRLTGVTDAGSVRRVALLSQADRTVILDDQSTWRFSPPGARLAGWKPGDAVTVQPDLGPKHLYRIVNRGRSDNVEVDFLGFS